MARKAKLFQWTGWAPSDVSKFNGRKCQVSCAAVFPSIAEFKRVTDTPQSGMSWVGVIDVPDEDPQNDVARAAIANPGVVFWRDDVRHVPKNAVVLEHTEPRRA